MTKTKTEKLTIPCAYQGGKQRIAKDIVDIFFKENEIDDETKFYDLCCGSGAVSIELISRGINPSNIVMVDKSVWGSFWQKIGNGEFSTDVFKLYIDNIPKDISQIKSFAENMSKQPANDGLFDNMVYKFLILQACSFGSKALWVENNTWKNTSFRNYWLPTETSNRKSPVNPMMPMPDTLFRRVEVILEKMEGLTGYCGDVTDITTVENNSVVYIDPPYKNTTGYGFNFDVDTYVHELQSNIKLHNKKAKIYVSEGYKMSENAHLISSKRGKGGISGERKSANEEWLSVFTYN
ncbi:hypothetical protein WKH56_19920 [Priestia sp. SB1]|uniref:hypothetical protein n=1 Tax=Priestia sp. SB1 TaxID=3132359 RepID=UPI00317F84E1